MDNGRRIRYNDIINRMKMHRSTGIYQGLWTLDTNKDQLMDEDT